MNAHVQAHEAAIQGRGEWHAERAFANPAQP